MDETYYKQFCELLRKMFMMDYADLDFGIYRIMNIKSQEITNFLDHNLLPQVKDILSKYVSGEIVDSTEKTAIEQQLNSKIAELKEDGYNDDEISRSKKVTKLREQLNNIIKTEHKTVNVDSLQSSVFSYLLTFFSRYYNDGDFISQRRYKGDNSYVIPYNGEETKLCWATEDQYYIKSTANLQNYTFVLADGRHKVRFILLSHNSDEEQGELNDNKNLDGKEHRFLLWDGNEEHPDALKIDGDELHIYFRYVLTEANPKQNAITDDIEKELNKLLADTKFEAWKGLLTLQGAKTYLRKNLDRYTEENKQDYFIHKDLGKFLKRELDFFIKNEVLSLDDLSATDEKRDAEYGEMRAIKEVGGKIIDFLAQLENFQKKLWLKKKFVISCNYCITLDRVPEELYPEICAKEEQVQDWIDKFKINTIKGDLVTKGYSNPLTVDFLKNHPYLVLDTKYFDDAFQT